MFIDPSERVPDEGLLEKMCRLKSSVATNMIVAFLVLTVVRQVMAKMQGARDRLGR